MEPTADEMKRLSLARKAPPGKDWLDINETILEVLALTRSQGQKNRITLETHLATDLPLILGDRIQLHQVLLNLILNAVEAMERVSDSPRQLLVSTSNDEMKGVLVEMGDSGPGLEAASLDQLFEAFYMTKADGMRMGLTISRSIIEADGCGREPTRAEVRRVTSPCRQERYHDDSLRLATGNRAARRRVRPLSGAEGRRLGPDAGVGACLGSTRIEEPSAART